MGLLLIASLNVDGSQVLKRLGELRLKFLVFSIEVNEFLRQFGGHTQVLHGLLRFFQALLDSRQVAERNDFALSKVRCRAVLVDERAENFFSLLQDLRGG